ncbi:sulfurtransferase complex subunit TusC [Methylomonas sp. AM2-LC]|uniref:sulfurtransferase complex subunit TusC n=1 Tax=Methylomonas sp. AM2-LC TaxID=3153301 RepID=UPI003263BBAC
MKKFLFIMRHLPNIGIHVQETLDMILTTAAFDQSVSLLFVDDGVVQLNALQNAKSLGLRDTNAVFSALEIYDVKQIYVEIESLQARGLQVTDLILPVQLIQRRETSAFLQQYDVLLTD